MVEGVDQPQSLVEELLRLRVRGGNGMMQASHSRHQRHRFQSGGILRPACACGKCNGRDLLHKDLQKSGVSRLTTETKTCRRALREGRQNTTDRGPLEILPPD